MASEDAAKVGGSSGGDADGVASGVAVQAPGARARCSADASEVLLEENLAALELLSASAAARVRAARSLAPDEGRARFDVAPDGGLTGIWPDGGLGSDDGIGSNSANSADVPSRAGAPGQPGQPAGRRLASARAPLDEARRWAQSLAIGDDAVLVLTGFGLGHHVRALASRVRGRAIIIAFEPDVTLLRAVLERHDVRDLVMAGTVRLVTEVEPGAMSAALASVLDRCEGLVAAGTRLIDHATSAARVRGWSSLHAGGSGGSEDVGAIAARVVARVVGAVRTQVLTTMVQVETTVRNLLQNVEWYATCPGIADLKGICGGSAAGGARAGIVVSAGPSLDRAMAALEDPRTRERAVIIATQTVLGTLLSRGIKPHFVVALDYHEISRRFYEGLTAEAVSGVTLVVEPKANPAILSAFPGAIRCVGDEVLDAVLGPHLAREMGTIPPGATVAHLAYGLARFMGCDPVILTGQDLAFTDGQYYGANAAIHRVWSSELNAFNTLEMKEWERVVRMRTMLRRVPAAGGGEVYTDEQMHTYLVQFEREFLADVQRGLTVIDASEGGGGARKAHTREMTLAEALEWCDARGGGAGGAVGAGESGRVLPPELGQTATPDAAWKRSRLAKVEARLREVRASVGRVEGHASTLHALLVEMREHHADQQRVNRLIARAQEASLATSREGSGHTLVQYLNQTGQFKRFKADRALAAAEGLSPMERQARQIDRDAMNAAWLRDAARRMGELVDDSIRTLHADGPGGSAKITRDLTGAQPAGGRAAARVRAVGVVTMVGVDDAVTTRDVGTGASVLAGTLGRLALALAERGTEILRGECVVITDEPGVARRALAKAAEELGGVGIALDVVAGQSEERAAGRGAESAVRAGLTVRVRELEGERARRARERRESMRVARSVGSACWRGAIANTTAWDEVLLAEETLEVLDESGAHVQGHTSGHTSGHSAGEERHSGPVAVVVGWDWCLMDARLTAALVSRHAENTEGHPICFAQVPPGAAGLVVTRGVLAELARATGPLATVGGILGYVPSGPRPDPIAKGVCVGVSPLVRDCAVRAIPDTAAGVRVVRASAGWNVSKSARREAARLDTSWLDAGWVGDGDDAAGGVGAGVGSLARAAASLEPCVEHLEVDLSVDGLVLSSADEARIAAAVDAGTIATVTIRVQGEIGAGLSGAAWAGLVARARALGGRDAGTDRTRARDAAVVVHVRTMLLGGVDEATRIIEAGADIISVDLVAGTRETYVKRCDEVFGVVPARHGEWFDACRAGLDALIARSREGWDARGGMPRPWVVPRIERCAMVRDEIEGVYDAGLMACGWCVMDSAREGVAGDAGGNSPGSATGSATGHGAASRGRFAALPIPDVARGRLSGSVVRVGRRQA